MTSICGVYCLYVGCEIHNDPANKMESVHLRFILCLHLNLIQMQTQIIFERGENMRPSSWQYRFRGVREPPTTLQQQDKVRLLISFWSYIWLTFDVCFDSVLFTLRLTYILNVCIDLMSCHLPFSIFGQKCHDLCDILGQTWKKLGIFLV